MSRNVIRAINLALLVLVCAEAAGMVRTVFESALPAQPVTASIAPVARPESGPRTWAERKVILERNLFNVSVLAPPAVAEPEEDLEDTKLPLKLLGTVAGAPEVSWAAVQDLQEGTHVVVRVGGLLQERAEVKVWLGGATALTIVMPQGRFTEEITVVSETPVIDPVQSNLEQVFDRDYLDRAAIGSSGRSYVSVLFQAAGADPVGNSANPSVFGSTTGENAYYIDGVDTTDPATSTFGVGLDFDAIQEIQIQTAGYEAEYGRAIGGMVNLVTRSGGNQFSGTLDARYRDDAFYESGDHFDSSELDNEYTAPGITLGGPIVRDRLWFFAAYEHRRITDTPVGSPTTRKAAFELPLAKLSWQIDPSWRLVAKYSASPNQHDNASASAYVAPEATQQIEWGGPQASVELAAILSDRLLWSTVGGIQRTKLDAGPQNGDISTPGHYNVSTGESYINHWGQAKVTSSGFSNSIPLLLGKSAKAWAKRSSVFVAFSTFRIQMKRTCFSNRLARFP